MNISHRDSVFFGGGGFCPQGVCEVTVFSLITRVPKKRQRRRQRAAWTRNCQVIDWLELQL